MYIAQNNPEGGKGIGKNLGKRVEKKVGKILEIAIYKNQITTKYNTEDRIIESNLTFSNVLHKPPWLFGATLSSLTNFTFISIIARITSNEPKKRDLTNRIKINRPE
jgi:hypothetical protein